MTSALRNSLSALALAAGLLAIATPAHAAQGDCGQPVTNGAQPVATDCLVILQTAVLANDCAGELACVCAPKGNTPTSATDALICLQVATAQSPPSVLNCPPPCGEDPPLGPQCSSAKFVTLPGSDIDSGWNGLGHNQSLVEGASITAGIVKRCRDDQGVICRTSADCPSSGPCDLTCACDSTNNTECEVFGPTDQRRCLRDLSFCDTNADCSAPQTCEQFFGPPLPISADGTPACVTSFFEEPITGTADSGTGEGSIAAFLRSRVHLGVGAATPCATCGTRAQNPAVGDTFTCGQGSVNTNLDCTVDAVSVDFGGTSFDCPPDPGTNVSGQGLAIIFKQATTGTLAVQATIPCGFPLSQAHPDVGQGTCNDDFSTCDTNADCTRCTNDLSSACTSDNDCSGGGTCAEAPLQPIACGVYCHCGFCGGTDIDQPCFGDADCAPGVQCMPGAGSGAPNPQTRHNPCANLICGEQVPEECCSGLDCINEAAFGSTDPVGACSLASFRPCSNDAQCAVSGSGTCVFTPNSCFGGAITRSGTPDALKKVCTSDFVTLCVEDADGPAGSICQDSSEPTTVSLFCIPPTTSEGINAAAGIPGPGTIRFKGRLLVARCGDGDIEADEQCDPPNGTSCGEDCQLIN
ncbi:MAG: hypothetical protein V3R77_01135 [Candidatus Binatia bacterium]